MDINIYCEKCKTLLIVVKKGKVKDNIKCYCSSCIERDDYFSESPSDYDMPDFLSSLFGNKQ